MKIILDHQESENYFYNSLCNGLSYLADYDLNLKYDEDAYKKAKETLKKDNSKGTICFEDVLMQILKQGSYLSLIDNNEEEENKEKRITIEDVWERVSKTDIRHLTDAIMENDDAVTADVILQTVFFEEVIYG
jgi:hypothetical protein